MQLTADAGAWTAAIVFASLARFEFDLSRVEPAMVVTAAATAVAVQAVAGVSSGLYLGKRRFGSFDEVAVLVRTAAGVTASLVLAGLLMEAVGRSRPVPLSVLLAGGVVAFVFMGAVRYAWRLWLERQLRPSGDEATRLLVYGAGDSAEQIVTAMLRKPDSDYVPVALLDDDPGKKNLRTRGLPVVGTSEAMAEAARCYDAQAVLAAIPSAGSDLVRDISTQARAVGLEVKVLPPVGELIGGQVGVGDIRPLTAADLLGRHEIESTGGRWAMSVSASCLPSTASSLRSKPSRRASAPSSFSSPPSGNGTACRPGARLSCHSEWAWGEVGRNRIVKCPGSPCTSERQTPGGRRQEADDDRSRQRPQCQ